MAICGDQRDFKKCVGNPTYLKTYNYLSINLGMLRMSFHNIPVTVVLPRHFARRD